MTQHFTGNWKMMVAVLGLSLGVGCGGAVEGEETLNRQTSRLDGALTLTLNGGDTLQLECGAGAWDDPGATAADGSGASLEVHTYNSGEDDFGPGPNAGAEGTYSVQYLAWDADGNRVGAIRTVVVKDGTAPTLTLNGEAQITHQCGEAFEDPGATATDACYGNLTATVERSGDFNAWVEGTYTLVYSVKDSAGHSAESVSRTVTVADCPW